MNILDPQLIISITTTLLVAIGSVIVLVLAAAALYVVVVGAYRGVVLDASKVPPTNTPDKHVTIDDLEKKLRR